MTDLIYLDYNATTPVDEGVLEAMLPFFREEFGNAASSHPAGRRATAAVEMARDQVAEAIGASAKEIVFTSGSTEATNLAIGGAVAAARGSDRGRLVTAMAEHKAVLDCVANLSLGKGDVVPVDQNGMLPIDVLESALGSDVLLASVIGANNETGVLNRIADLAAVVRDSGALFHCDATQMLGRVPLHVDNLGVDLLSLSSHKVYGPKGVGALYVRRGTPLTETMFGGGHENGMRSGTLNVPGIVGFGAAARLAVERQPEDARRQREQVARLLDGLRSSLGGVVENGGEVDRLPNTLNVRFVGADAEAVIANCPRLAISTGSACTAMIPSPSHVLLAMGLDHEVASECVRISVGRPTTDAEIDLAVGDLAEAVTRVREMT